MKTSRLLRVLSLLAFLLLFAPFYDACDGKSFFKRIPENDIVVEKPFREKAYEVIVNEDAFNGFDIAAPMVTNSLKSTKEELIELSKKKDWYNNLTVIISLIFNFIVLISFLLFVLSFLKKKKLIVKLALINSILTTITFLYIVCLESSFGHLRQIKWGYYAFIITNVLILCYSRKSVKSTQIHSS